MSVRGLIASFALVVMLAVPGVPAARPAAGTEVVQVALTGAGPSPSTVRMYPATELVNFVNQESVSHTVVFADGHCSLTIPPGSPPANWGDCHGPHGQWPFYTGSYAYTMDGTFPGRIDVVGFPRSLSLAARTDTVRLGGRLTLTGHLTIGKGGPCAVGRSSPLIRVLARHDRSHPFKRIAMFRLPFGTATVGRHSCTYTWRLHVRPGLPTIYIADSKVGTQWWRPATSRPFRVLIRP